MTSECHDLTEKALLPTIIKEEALKNQTKAVLLAELVSLELFYGLEDLVRDGSTGKAQGVASSKLHSLTDKDLLLHSAETLLEVYSNYVVVSSMQSCRTNQLKVISMIFVAETIIGSTLTVTCFQ